MTDHALFADYYEFMMLRAYFELSMTEEATFSLFVRKLPPHRNFLVACGLATVLDEVESLRFSDEQLGFLHSLGEFPDSFLEWLRGFRFTGDIYAISEGTPFFPEEPILEVTAPIAEAQFLETLILNQIGLQTILASKATRMVAAARGRVVSDFGARRAQGFDAAIKGARAFYIGGVDSTSLVEGGFAYGLRLAGTMAHSFIEAHDSEAEAFANFKAIYPNATLLVDTYDSVAGVEKAIALAKSHGSAIPLNAIRLDSGDLLELAHSTRKLLDDAGFTHTRIVASGALDENAIDRLTSCGAPIDLFGVGTEMATSADAPALDIAYKLVEYNGKPRMKLSTGKGSLPDRKQVFRQFESRRAVHDVIALGSESLSGVPLLQPVMLSGRRTHFDPSLKDVRRRCEAALAALPEQYRQLGAPAEPFSVRISDKLTRLERNTRNALEQREVDLKK